VVGAKGKCMFERGHCHGQDCGFCTPRIPYP